VRSGTLEWGTAIMSLSLRHPARLTSLTFGVLLSLVATTVVAVPAASAAAITANPDALDGTCASLRVYNGSSSVGYVNRSGAGYGFTSSASGAMSFRLEATQLGRYEVFGSDGKPAYQSVVGFIMAGDSYGDRADFTVTKVGDRYRFTATATGQVMGSFLWSLGAAGSA
jgi:hypothetical protein